MTIWYIFAVLVLLFSGTVLYLGRIVKRRTEEIRSKFGPEDMILATSNANFFGTTSRGSFQVRGNGYLILTSEALYFLMLIPRREIVIDISSISTAEKGLWHIGKTKSRTLLKVRYSTGDVTEDTAAWLVGDPERWISEINGMK